MFRDLTEKEIDCRVAMVKNTGVSLLLYKDARCDMNILDETVGPTNWQRRHELINGNLFCSIGININYMDESAPQEYVWKQDVGVESYTEKEKGQASDAFKRAGFNWGIGRELYTAPFIWINSENVKIAEANGKCTTRDQFVVEQILINNKTIVALSIRNKTLNKRAFVYDGRPKKKDAMEIPEEMKKQMPFA